MKAIQTKYNGYHFRSRLEARWAVFFDKLGIKYEYEPEGFELPSGRYLPDFYLPEIDSGLWVEIKRADEDWSDKLETTLSELAEMTGKPATLIRGEPMLMVQELGDRTIEYPIFWSKESGDNSYIFCECPWCKKIGFEFDGRGARVCGYKKHYDNEDDALAVIKHLGHWRADDKCYSGFGGRFLDAAIAARSARFEFGGK